MSKECCGAECSGGCDSPACAPAREKGPTLGEAAMKVLRSYGSHGATAAEVAGCVRGGAPLLGLPPAPSASTPAILTRLTKYARRGTVRLSYVTDGPVRVARFYA